MLYFPYKTVRICFALVGFCGVLVAPWWVPLACMVLLSLRYAAWEVPLMGLLTDLVWFSHGGFFAFHIFTVLGIALVWLAYPLRRQFLL